MIGAVAGKAEKGCVVAKIAKVGSEGEALLQDIPVTPTARTRFANATSSLLIRDSRYGIGKSPTATICILKSNVAGALISEPGASHRFCRQIAVIRSTWNALSSSPGG